MWLRAKNDALYKDIGYAGILMRHLSILLLLSGTIGQAQDWVWRGTSPLLEARSEACMLRLPDGRAIVSGGRGAAALASVEIFRTTPEEAFIAAAPMLSARAGHGCALLEDGRVLVAGGGASGFEIYEPALDAWTSVVSGVVRGAGTIALRLPDGRILIGGGRSNLLETFDSVSGEVLVLPVNLLAARDRFTMTLLRDGKVLIAGGVEEQETLLSAELFDAETGELRALPPMPGPRAGHTATLLFDGRVLLAGGTDGKVELNTLEVYSPESKRFETLVAVLKVARQDHTGLLVESNGTVLLAGGLAAGEALASSELFDASTDQVVEAGSLTAARTGIASLMLEDGSVLASGGRNADGASKACGVIVASAVQFTQKVYRPLEQATIAGGLGVSGLNPRVRFDLKRVQLGTGAQTSINSRLLVTTANLQKGNLLPITGVMNIFRDDIGSDFVLTINATKTTGEPVSVQSRFSAKLPTAMKVSAIGGITIAGQPVIARVELTGDGNPIELSGLMTVRAGTLTTVFPVSGKPTAFVTDVALCCIATESTIQISGSYAGSPLLEAATAASSVHPVVSKTPVISFTPPTLAFGTASTFTALVGIQNPGVPISQGVAASLRPSGALTFQKSTGESIGTAELVAFRGITTSSLPLAQAQITYTPGIPELRARSACFATSYSGDSRYSAVPATRPFIGSAGPGCVAVAAAVSKLEVVASPASYTLGTLTRFSVKLTWPDAVGILSRTVNVLGGGRVFGQLTLVPNPNGLGIAEGSVELKLPFDAKNVSFSYDASGDLQGSQATLAIAMLPVGTTLTTTLRDPIVNPFRIPFALALSTGGVALPPGAALGGSIEFLDGNTLIGTLAAPILQAGPGITDGTSNTILIGEVQLSGALTNVIRPTGQRTITIRFTGSALFAATQVVVRVNVP